VFKEGEGKEGGEEEEEE
jgi:hypothetical protein